MSKVTIDNLTENEGDDIPYGTLLRFTDTTVSSSYGSEHILFYAFDCLIDLNDPSNTWNWGKEVLQEYIDSGSIMILPKGTKVTIKQE
jgi:hypothetical protein